MLGVEKVRKGVEVAIAERCFFEVCFAFVEVFTVELLILVGVYSCY